LAKEVQMLVADFSHSPIIQYSGSMSGFPGASKRGRRWACRVWFDLVVCGQS